MTFAEADKVHLNFGNCCVGCSTYKSFRLNYPVEGELEYSQYCFEWQADTPHLEFEPMIGKLKPGSSVEVIAKFRSDEPISYQLSPIRCRLVRASSVNISEVCYFINCIITWHFNSTNIYLNLHIQFMFTFMLFCINAFLSVLDGNNLMNIRISRFELISIILKS